VDTPLFGQIPDFAQQHAAALALLGIALVALLLLLWLARRWLRRRDSSRAGDHHAIDVGLLPQLGPPPGLPVLEFYNVPVRLAAVVLAPVGRLRDLPTREELPDVLDAIVPGLDQVAAAHHPLIQYWPRQVSVRGFAHTFANLVRLPGDHGRRTPWCSVAGVFRVDDHPMMAGLVLCAETSNRHGHHVVTHENQWLGILRIRLDDFI